MTYLQEKKEPARAAPAGAQSSHDTQNPKALLKFMMTDWAQPSAALPARHPHADHFAARRKALSALFPGEPLVIPTGHEKVRANDTTFRFRPGSDFVYLTGNHEPDGVLVLVPRASGKGHDAHLFVEPNPGRSNETFFTDRKKGELWVGPRLGLEQTRARSGLEHVHALPELRAFVRPWAKKALVVAGLSETTERLFPRPSKQNAGRLAQALSELRLLKDPAEIAELRAAIASTKRGFEDVLRALPRLKSEREVEGHFALRARTEGNDTGYGTIAAAGAHACTLHWTHNDGALRQKDLLLLDAGVEAHSLYTADITRTVPIGGTFSKPQRAVYELVWKAQQAALAQVKPGNDFMDPNRAAMRVLAEGLVALGILRTTADEALKDEHQFYKRYSLHNVSHMLGLDVHDCARARAETYKYGKLRAGMVLTVEPGLYFQLDDLTVPPAFRGIGVRIEDDVLVTPTGMKNLSAAIPSQVDAVEDWVASLR